MTDRRAPPIAVTDHAIIRWLERVERWDIAELRAYLARAARVGVDLGAEVVVVPRGKLILSADRVVTVLRADQETLMRRAAEMPIDLVLAHRDAKRRRR